MKRHIRFWGSVLLGVAFFIAMVQVMACSGLRQKRGDSDCKPLFDLIKTDWVRDDTGIYQVRRGSKGQLGHDIIANQNCFVGLKEREIEKLFGKPDTVYRGRLVYYMAEPCLQKDGVNANGCSYMECSMDGEGRAKGVEFNLTSYKH